MQDDFYIIALDGWKAETSRVIDVDKKGKEKDKGWVCDLIPKAYIVARYFADAQAVIDDLTTQIEGLSAELSELEEEQGGDEGIFAEFDKVNKAAVMARLKEIKGEADSAEDVSILRQWLILSTDITDLKKQFKLAEAALDLNAYNKYPELGVSEIKMLVVEDKWLNALEIAIHGETNRISQGLTQRVKELAERYESPMPTLTGEVAELEAKVNQHLNKMGFSWS